MLPAPPAKSGLSTWSVHHPIGVVIRTPAVMVLGACALGRLNINLLPHGIIGR